MPPRSGVGAQIIGAKETTYGTFQAPTRSIRFNTEGLDFQTQQTVDDSIGAGLLAQAGDGVVQTTRQGSGPINRPVRTKGEGIWLDMGHGNAVTPATPGGATLARTQTHEYGETDPFGKSMTIQVGRPDTSGTVRAHSYLGCKLMSRTWECEQSGLLTVAEEWDIRDLDLAQSLATNTPVAGARPWRFDQFGFEFDDAEYTECIRKFTIAHTIPSKTDDFCGNQVKVEPIQNAFQTVIVTLDMRFASNAQLTALLADTRRKLAILGTDGTDTIEAGFSNELSWTFPETMVQAVGPKVEGKDVIQQSVQLMIVGDGTDPLMTILTQSTDTAL